MTILLQQDDDLDPVSTDRCFTPVDLDPLVAPLALANQLPDLGQDSLLGLLAGDDVAPELVDLVLELPEPTGRCLVELGHPAAEIAKLSSTSGGARRIHDRDLLAGVAVAHQYHRGRIANESSRQAAAFVRTTALSRPRFGVQCVHSSQRHQSGSSR